MSNQFLDQEVLRALDKHLRDNVIIHHESEFKQTKGPETRTVTTVAYCKDEGSNAKFVKKNEGTESAIVEIIAGNLYKALLYERSPTFKLVETSCVEFRPLKLKSNLLRSFTTLSGFMTDKREKKLIDLIYEKFASKSAQEELRTYMFVLWHDVERFMNSVKYMKSKIKGSEKFFDSIIKQLENRDPYTKIESLPEFKDVLIQIFNNFKDDKKCEDLFCANMNYGIERVIKESKYVKKCLEYILNSSRDEDYRDKTKIENIKESICDSTKYTSSFYTIGDRLNQQGFSKEFLTKILEEVEEKTKKAKEIKKQLSNYANQELRKVGGLEKIIVPMMLFGYSDLHSANIGVMDIEHENRDGSTTTEKVYAKVDMSASFHNLKNTHYLYYLRNLESIVLDSRAAQEESLNWYDTIDYNKLKEEINKGCDLFINNHEYVESLIHRSLFYRKPLLKTAEELGLVNELVEEIVTQAKLLKEFANSTEFASLIDNRDDLRNYRYSTQRGKEGMMKTKESVIKTIIAKVESNLRNIKTSSLVDHYNYSVIASNNESLTASNCSNSHISSNETNDNEGSTLENQNIRKISVLLSEGEPTLDITNSEKNNSEFVGSNRGQKGEQQESINTEEMPVADIANGYISVLNSEQESNTQNSGEQLSNLDLNTNPKLQANDGKLLKPTKFNLCANDDISNGTPETLALALTRNIERSRQVNNKVSDTAKNTQKNNVAITLATIAILAIHTALIAHFVFQASLLTTGIIAGVGACCLVASAAILSYDDRPPNSLENSNVEEFVTNEEHAIV